MSIDEVLFFHDRLTEASMPRGAFVVNRFRCPPPLASTVPSEADVSAAAIRRGLAFGTRRPGIEDDAPARLARAHADAKRLASLDASYVEKLEKHAGPGVPVVRVPELPTDVRDLASLNDVASTLMSGGV
jgi:hypothetical protein